MHSHATDEEGEEEEEQEKKGVVYERDGRIDGGNLVVRDWRAIRQCDSCDLRGLLSLVKKLISDGFALGAVARQAPVGVVCGWKRGGGKGGRILPSPAVF